MPYRANGDENRLANYRTPEHISRFAPDAFGSAYEFDGSAVTIPAGSATADTTYYNRGSSGTRLQTQVGDHGTVSVTFDSPKDLTGRSIYIRTYHHDDNGREAYVKVAAPTFGDWGIYHITSEVFPVASSGSWSEWIIHVSELQTQAGAPDYSQVNTINFELYPQSGTTTEVTFDEVSFFDQRLDRGKVVFMFDDNNPTIESVGKTVLDRYGFNGTWAWIPTDPGLSISDFGRRVHRLGWHISVHDGPQWPTLSEAELRSRLENALDEMRDNNITQLPTATYPNGRFTDDVIDVLADYFVAARATTGGWPPVNQYQLPANQIDTGGVANATQYIDRAAQYNRGLILVNHAFGGANEMTEAEYDSVVSHAANANIDVVTLDRLIGEL